MPAIYPFTAIVGQERMRRALILNAVDTRIGGVLIRGERGTAKSTAARALAALLAPGQSRGRLPLRMRPRQARHLVHGMQGAVRGQQSALAFPRTHHTFRQPARLRHRRPRGWARSISSRPSKKVNAILSRACSPTPIAVCSTSMK